MNDDGGSAFRDAVNGLLGGAAPLFEGFGLERVAEGGALWYERMTADGTGRATFFSQRSIGDASGEEVGWFEGAVPRERIVETLQALLSVVESAPPAPHLEPGDMRTTVRAVAGGATWERVIGGDPMALEPFQPLLLALDQIVVLARQRAVATLGLDFSLGASLRPGSQEVDVTLVFANRGTEGVWIRNPSAAMEDQPEENCRLIFAREPHVEAGVTPLPPEIQEVPLMPVQRAERALLWLSPGAKEERVLRASVEIDPGPHLLRTGFASYRTADGIGGKRVLRGCVFSPEKRVMV